MLYLVVIIVAIGSINCGGQPEPEPRVNVLYYGQYDECEGKDANNYTLLSEFTEDQTGNPIDREDEDDQLIQCGPNGARAVDSLKILARSVYPAGAYNQRETLWLITGGPLQGRYLYEKIIYLALAYLKRFSSVLGYSYVTTKSASLLINDRLDLAVLISPTGAYEVFKKGCTTICRGRGYFVA